jgi:peptidoglycan/xylan/chitin deacetylase (PgdA/CDA1 family)
MRRERFALLSLDEVVARLEEGRPLERAVAFTIDDGYADHAEVAAPLFAEFDCPVTTFVVTGFLDGKLWLWWNRIETAFALARRRSVEVPLGGAVVRYAWEDASGRDAAMVDFVEACKRVPDAEKHQAIDTLADRLQVLLPAEAPPACAPMTWVQLRRAEAGGMRFGPHTVTHPVLSRTTDAQARDEIAGSWARLRAEATAPSPAFCYPNGQWDDFLPRDVALLEEVGLKSAVVGVTGYAEGLPDTRYRLRRFPFPDDLGLTAQYAGGFERLKRLMRGSA